MAYERIVGLDITDEAGYRRYREGMLPILARYGGEFGYDFRVSEVLLAKTPEPINRVFTISFPSREKMEAFFADPAYIAVQRQHMAPSVGARTIISLHEKDS